MSDSHVPTGYEIGKDEQGLTAKEREAMTLLLAGKSVSAVGLTLGVSRQRAHQLATSLVKHGAIKKEGRTYVPAVQE